MRPVVKLSDTVHGQEIADRLRSLHERVVASPRSVVCAGLEQDGTLLSQLLSESGKTQGAHATADTPEGIISIYQPGNVVFDAQSLSELWPD